MNKQRIGSLYGFMDVDHSIHPISYIDYLDQSNASQGMRRAKEQMVSFLQPQNGHALLDIGCGVGHDAQMLANFVGKTGSVVGIDTSKVMIQEAKRRFRRAMLPVEFHACDAHRLDFPANRFNGSVCFSVLTHCEQPTAVISEAFRVLKPGGRLVVLEPDWDSLVISTGEQASDELLKSILKKSVCHSGIAHRLPHLFTQCGFKFVTAEAIPLATSDYALANRAWRIEPNIAHVSSTGTVSAADADHLRCRLRNPMHQFFGAFMVFAVMGTKRPDRFKRQLRKQKDNRTDRQQQTLTLRRRNHAAYQKTEENHRQDATR